MSNQTSVVTPTRTSHTTIAIIVSVISGLPALAEQFRATNLLPTWAQNALSVVSILALWVAPILARHSAAVAVQAVETKADNAVETATQASQSVAAVARSVDAQNPL